MSELLPCPFCGGKALLDSRRVISNDHGEWWVFCVTPTCNIIGPKCSGPESAEIIWNNRRPSPDSVKAPEDTGGDGCFKCRGILALYKKEIEELKADIQGRIATIRGYQEWKRRSESKAPAGLSAIERTLLASDPRDVSTTGIVALQLLARRLLSQAPLVEEKEMNERDVYPCCGRTEAEIHDGDRCLVRALRAEVEEKEAVIEAAPLLLRRAKEAQRDLSDPELAEAIDSMESALARLSAKEGERP